MPTQLIQKIKAMLLCIVYAMLFVDTVDTKIKACNALNCVCYVVCRHCWHKDSGVCGSNIIYLLRAFQPYHQLLYMSTLLTLGISISNAFNAIYVKAANTKCIHTFLPITFLIFNRFSIRKKFWKAETEGFSTIPSNTIYVDTVDTSYGILYKI